MSWDLNIANSSTASQCRWYTMFVMFKAWYRQQRLPGTLLPNQSVGVTSVLGLLQISAVWNQESQSGLGWKVPCRPAHSKPLALGRHIPLGQVDVSGPHSAKRCHKKKNIIRGHAFNSLLLWVFCMISARKLYLWIPESTTSTEIQNIGHHLDAVKEKCN